MSGGGIDPVLRFMVKFYMPDPSQLEEEYTRWASNTNFHLKFFFFSN